MLSCPIPQRIATKSSTWPNCIAAFVGAQEILPSSNLANLALPFLQSTYLEHTEKIARDPSKIRPYGFPVKPSQHPSSGPGTALVVTLPCILPCSSWSQIPCYCEMTSSADNTLRGRAVF